MVQVVTNENIQQLIQTRQVPEFKAPDVKVEAAKPSEAAAAKPADTASAASEPAKAEQPRAEDGKFVKADEPKKDDTAAKAADDDDASDMSDADVEKLPEEIRRQLRRAQRQIGKKHRGMKEAEEFARDEYSARRAAEERAAALERQLQELKSKSGPKPDEAKGSDPDEPKPEDFKTVGEYAKALTKWEVAQARKSDQAQVAQDRQKQAIETVQQRFAERIAETAKAIPDYHEVVGEADWEVPHHMQAYFVDSENGARLGYELAKNRAEFDRIAKLSPVRAIAELGKLEDKLFAKAPVKEPAAAATQVSRAPAPIQPLEGKSTTVTKDPSQMSFAELRAHRQAERAAGRGR